MCSLCLRVHKEIAEYVVRRAIKVSQERKEMTDLVDCWVLRGPRYLPNAKHHVSCYLSLALFDMQGQAGNPGTNGQDGTDGADGTPVSVLFACFLPV